MTIYRIKCNGAVEYVDELPVGEKAAAYIENTYLYDSAVGERYFVLGSSPRGRPIYQFRVDEPPRPTKLLTRIMKS